MSLTTAIGRPIISLYTLRSEERSINQQKNTCFRPTLQFRPLSSHFQPNEKKLSIRITPGSRVKRSALICYAADAQTQTITRQSSTATVAPEKSPKIDDGGPGFPPGDDGDGGGGGGGGGGGHWSGGFFFFGFLAFLGFLKDQENEEGPSYSTGRR